MQRIRNNIYTVIIMFAILLVASCSSLDCTVSSKVLCSLGIEYAENDTVTPNYYLSLSAQRISDGNDTVLINRVQNASSVSVPLSHVGDVDVLHLLIEKDTTLVYTDSIEHRKDSIVMVGYDAISISKTNTPVFESVDCDTRYDHVINGVTTTNNVIESASIIDKNVKTRTSDENIHIILRSAK